MSQDELKERLAKIKTAEDFVRIFNQVWPLFNGSPKRCADELMGQTPPNKHKVADKGITQLQQRFPGTSWYYAGD